MKTARCEYSDLALQLALPLSCVGQKLVLQPRTNEEMAAVGHVSRSGTLLLGFYAYGALSPVAAGEACRLYHQKMTITTFYETE